MAPFTESDAGAMYRGGDLTNEAEYADAEEREQQAAARREVASRIGTGERKPTQPAARGPEAGRLTPSTIAAMTAEQRDAWLEASREARKDPRHPINDERHPEHAAALAEFENIIMGSAANPVLGTVHEGGRLRPVETEIAGTYEEMPEAGVTADRPEQDAVMSLARSLGGESVEIYRDFLYEASRLYASGDPPDDLALHQELTAARPTSATWR